LDLLRGIAAFGVAISHFFYLTGESLLAETLSTIFVEIFFPLSGFVLADQILRCRREPRNLKIFFYRRWLRTIPPYLIAVFCMAILFDQVLTSDFLIYALFLQDAVPGMVENQFFNIAWSLSVEEYFYLLFPLVILFGPRNPVVSALLFIAVFQIARILLVSDVEPQFIRIGTFLRLDSIAFGFLVYLALQNRAAKIIIWPILGLIISGVLLGALYLEIASGRDSGLLKLAYINVASLFGISMLVFFHQTDTLFPIRGIFRIVSIWAGKISYPIYLFHILILQLMLAAFDTIGVVHFQIYIVALIGFTITFHVVFERPILEMRPRFIPDAATPPQNTLAS